MKRNSLMCVKSIITIFVVGTLCALTIAYPKDFSDTFKSVATMVATFYFTHQVSKNENAKTERDGDIKDEVS